MGRRGREAGEAEKEEGGREAEQEKGGKGGGQHFRTSLHMHTSMHSLQVKNC